MVYVLIAILLFGFLVLAHEFGHYIFARIFHVTINEFAIGMGPKLVSVKSKKTNIAYSLRLFPIGGYVSMVGEDEMSDDPNAFCRKPLWQRLIITVAGCASNILIGFIVMGVIVMSSPLVTTTVVAGFGEKATSCEYGLSVGDEIIAVGPRTIHTADDLSFAISRYGDKPVDVTVIRDGRKTTLSGVIFPTSESQGVVFGTPDFHVYGVEKNFGNVVKGTFYGSVATIRLVFDSLYDLITGKYGFSAISGPVGAADVISQTAKSAVEEKDFSNLFFLFTVLAMNLGVMNLLPIPALDGGRIFFMLVELITRKKVPQKLEGLVHFIGLALLLAFMVAVTFKDIIFIFNR